MKRIPSIVLSLTTLLAFGQTAEIGRQVNQNGVGNRRIVGQVAKTRRSCLALLINDNVVDKRNGTPCSEFPAVRQRLTNFRTHRSELTAPESERIQHYLGSGILALSVIFTFPTHLIQMGTLNNRRLLSTAFCAMNCIAASRVVKPS